MHNNPYFNVFLDHVMNLYKVIETCLKDDNMDIFLMINALISINNYVITCINSMLSSSYQVRSVALPFRFPQTLPKLSPTPFLESPHHCTLPPRRIHNLSTYLLDSRRNLPLTEFATSDHSVIDRIGEIHLEFASVPTRYDLPSRAATCHALCTHPE